MEDAGELFNQAEGANLENVPSEKQETCDEVLSRHREEIARLQNEMKKDAASDSKAAQKAKKKLVEEDISKLFAELRQKHAKELAKLGYISSSRGQEKGNLDNLVEAIAGVSVNGQTNYSKPGKSTMRREKRAQQEAAREQRIKEEQTNITVIGWLRTRSLCCLV